MEKSRSRLTSASALAGTGLSLVIKVVVGVPPKLVDVHFFLFRRFVILNIIDMSSLGVGLTPEGVKTPIYAP